MEKTITGRITLNLIAGIVISVLTVIVGIAWMATKQNDQAAHSTSTMVEGGLNAMAKRVQSLANDYGWWEDAYNAYTKKDDGWMEDNVGSSVTGTEIADMMAIISPAGSVDYGWVLDDGIKADQILVPNVIERIRALTKDMPVENLQSRTAYIDPGEGKPIMLVAVSRIVPVSRAAEVDPATLPYFVVGFFLSPTRLGELGSSFLISDLRIDRSLEQTDAKSARFLPVVDIFGRTAGHLVWTPPTPGYAVLRSVLVPITLALGLFCVVALATAFGARKLALKLSDSEKEAVVAARTDSMTGLKNRMGFIELIESPAAAEACEAGHLAVIYLDINGFKGVNDSIGHHGGDALVKALADRLTSVLMPDCVLARIGGDEFAILMTGRSATEAVAAAASAIVHSLDLPFSVEGFEFHVSVSIGYAVAGAGIAASEVVRRADLAMYHAKAGAEREAVAYHSTMETGALEKKQVEAGLRRAIENGDLSVVYQPFVRSSDLAIVGVEALVRWNSKEFGNVPPTLFIPVAEETGLIHDVGRFVVDRACRDLLNWPDVKMAINVSPVQLREPNFANDIMAIIERHGLSPRQFELELTEGILVNNPTIAKRKLATLKSLGFSLAIDDFGTGFSSIGYLRQFPFDVLKVDRSFVRDVGMNTTANALIQSLVSLGDAMDLAVIAEGIENEDQLRLLRLVQCEYVQGYHISRPVPAEDVNTLIARLGRSAAPGPGRDHLKVVSTIA